MACFQLLSGFILYKLIKAVKSESGRPSCSQKHAKFQRYDSNRINDEGTTKAVIEYDSKICNLYAGQK